jgi:hypothetical protein
MKTRALLAMLAVAGLTVAAAAADLDLIVNDKRLSQPAIGFKKRAVAVRHYGAPNGQQRTSSSDREEPGAHAQQSTTERQQLIGRARTTAEQSERQRLIAIARANATLTIAKAASKATR